MAAKFGHESDKTDEGRGVATVGYIVANYECAERRAWFEAEMRANAHLFAAAPEMLAILMELGRGQPVNLCCINRVVTKALGGIRADA